MIDRLRIAVTGLAATYPFGGVFWDYLQYPLGFKRLGHDVLYIEDAGRWCYDPYARTFVTDGRNNAARLARHIEALDPGLVDRWFFRDVTGATYGRRWPDVVRYCRSADLFVHLSASCMMTDEYLSAGRTVFVDTDPVYTQASLPGYVAGTIDEAARARVDMIRAHDVFFTFGENVGRPGCAIPTDLIDWHPTRQPVLLDRFERASVPVGDRRGVLTTMASWEPADPAPVVGGRAYGSKSIEFERFITLPSRSKVPLELALSGEPPLRRLRAHGWSVVDAWEVSHDPWTYREYLARSLGEWSVAKNAYVASRSGWFSGRTASYLALGVPAAVQDTGLEGVLPTGEGVIAFRTLDEAAAAVEELAGHPGRHAAAARAFVREYFYSDRVLARLLDTAGKSSTSTAGRARSEEGAR